jgi:hypothetical protein
VQAAGLVLLTTVALFSLGRKPKLDRDCADYKGTPADFFKIMNNTDFETFKVRRHASGRHCMICTMGKADLMEETPSKRDIV